MPLTKIDDRGLTTPIDFLDNEKVRLGTGNDLEIYHNGTDSFIDNSTGNLKIIASNDTEAIKVFNDGTVNIGANADNVQLRFGIGSDLKLFHNGTNSHIHSVTGELDIRSNDFHLRNEANNEDMITATQNGPVELFYDGARVFETDNASVKLRDNIKANFGTGNDLQIYHDGSNSFIKDAGTGSLWVYSNDFRVASADGNEHIIKATENSGVELYFNGVSKLETRAGDTIFHDDIVIQDNNKIKIGTGDDLQIYHDGGHSYIHQDGTGNLYILADTFRLNNEANTENIIAGNANGAVELYYNNLLRLDTTSDGADIRSSGSATAIRIKTDGGTTRGWLYANNGNMVGLLDEGGDWAIKHINNSGTEFYVATNKKATINTHGLTFNSDTAAANALDDYEEGTHTLSTNSNLTLHSSYNVSEYTKVGNVVTMTFLFYVSSVSGSDVVNVSMPFVNRSGTGSSRTDAVGTVMHDGVNTGDNGVKAYIGQGDNSIRFYKVYDNGSWGQLSNSDLSSGDQMYVTITYRTA